MTAIELSVVVPTFNRASLLDRCLAALAAQEEPGGELEVVVVDDGSTDETPRVLERYASLLPLRFERQPNRGQPAARAKSMEGGGFAAAHLPGAALGYGAASPASRALRVSCGNGLPATLDPGDLGGPWDRKSGQAQGLPRPGARRAGPCWRAAAASRTSGTK